MHMVKEELDDPLDLKQLYLKSPMARGIRIWETLTSEMQRAPTKVKFKQMIKALCR